MEPFRVIKETNDDRAEVGAEKLCLGVRDIREVDDFRSGVLEICTREVLINWVMHEVCEGTCRHYEESSRIPRLESCEGENRPANFPTEGNCAGLEVDNSGLFPKK